MFQGWSVPEIVPQIQFYEGHFKEIQDNAFVRSERDPNGVQICNPVNTPKCSFNN